MRVLLVDLALKYVNPTRGFIPRLLTNFDTTIFGPGYVSSESLSDGLAHFVRRNGTFDAIIVTEHIAFADSWVGKDVEKAYFRNYRFSFPASEIYSRKSLLNEIRSISLPKVLLTMESDYYNFRKEQIDVMIRDFDFVVGWNEQFLSRCADLPNLKNESFGACANDNWLDFVKSYSHKIIPVAHFVGDNEFYYGALEHRRADFSVPGAAYESRIAAKAALLSAGCTINRPRKLPLVGILNRMGVHPLSWSWFLNYYQESFREEICQSRISYTCGSSLGYPIRKFFEIPAAGALLICQPCNGFDALGFVHGENALICDPDDLPDVGRELLVDLERAQQIADAGRQLVSQFHTVGARAKQLSHAVRRALSGDWHGGYWRDARLESAEPLISH